MAFQVSDLQAGDHLSRATRVLSTAVEGETVMLALNTGLYHSLEGVAARIWELLETTTTLDDMARLIAAEYGVAEEQCAADIRDFLGDLIRADLVLVAHS